MLDMLSCDWYIDKNTADWYVLLIYFLRLGSASSYITIQILHAASAMKIRLAICAVAYSVG